MTEQQISNRGVEASQVLENPAFQEAMEALRASVVAKWREVSVRDKEGLVLTHQLMTLADTFEGLLKGFVEAGKYADHKIEIDKLRDEPMGKRILRKVL